MDFIKILDEQNPVDGTDVYVNDIEEMLARFYDFVRQNPEVAQIVIDKSQDQTIINRFIEILTERYTELLISWKFENTMY